MCINGVPRDRWEVGGFTKNFVGVEDLNDKANCLFFRFSLSRLSAHLPNQRNTEE